MKRRTAYIKPSKFASLLSLVGAIGGSVFLCSLLGGTSSDPLSIIFTFAGIMLGLSVLYHITNLLTDRAPAMEVLEYDDTGTEGEAAESQRDRAGPITEEFFRLQVAKANGAISSEEFETRRRALLRQRDQQDT